MAERNETAGERRGGGGARNIADTLDTMKAQAKDVAREVGAQAGAASAAAQREIGRLGEQMRGAAGSLLDEQQDRMASAVQGVADMLRRTAETLEREDNATAAHYADQAAAQIDRLSETVRSRRLGEMVTGAEAFARRQPALFIAGAVATGFVIGRLLARPADETGERAGDGAGGEAMAGYAAGSGVGGERI
jgi:uncharacterized protein YukE